MFICVLLTSIAPVFAKTTSSPKRYALLVAVTRYEDDKLNTPPLKYPEDDATELSKRLTDGGYKVETLRGAQATQEAIRDKLSQLGNRGNADGALILGFFGHGVEFAGTEEAMFCPYGTTMRYAKDKAGNPLFEKRKDSQPASKMMEPDPKSLVGMSEMLDALRLCKAGNKLLLADCCRKSPNAARGRAFGTSIKLSDLPSKTAAIFACSEGEEAQEDDSWQHGAMTKCFLDLLPELSGDSNDINAITGRLARNVSNIVRESTGGKKTQTLHPIVNGIVELKLSEPEEVSKRYVSASTGMEFILVPKGTFMMGSPESEVGYDGKHQTDEVQHQVTISKPYYLGKYEVTQSEFESVMGFNPSRFNKTKFSNADGLPVENLTWFDAVMFCNTLSQRDGRSAAYTITRIVSSEVTKNIWSASVELIPGTNGYRLPTEFEWEHACRAGTNSAFSTGATLTTDQANIESKSTMLSKSFQPNPLGLHNMQGNVWEWCQDWYDDYPRGNVRDPIGSLKGSFRVYRGGGWSFSAVNCRSAVRLWDSPNERFDIVGFRIVLPSLR